VVSKIKNELCQLLASLASPAKLLGKCRRVWGILKLGQFLYKKVYLCANYTNLVDQVFLQIQVLAKNGKFLASTQTRE
jgi:hypothetical protein